MEKFAKENATKIHELLSEVNAVSNNEVGKIPTTVSERIVEAIVDDSQDTIQLIFTTRHKIYFVDLNGDNSDVKTVGKDEVIDAEFLRGAPEGKCIIKSASENWTFDHIVGGRVFDFIQDIKPKEINHAGYDNTVRGEFHQLLDPDHAEEIDKLRKYMQEGNISHYEYDDINPAISKAGK
ncbi:MAG: histidine decarboxylase maturation protein HdcB [Levilactobacillus sp.]|jgi:hypothetical protein|uniref:histidine decarboxylase maturation protein HdcB n=1 Tax=Levilactobacillus sp. TaxID=2767919 RepID=UPI002590012A|nr:histidine decarboxylase maturation protein HdcB [Levilactobacillus sp.]MCI1554457.1 histidine decarboxylase maturation protein HdcB [Levilactobacillus sp.]MCI1598212.1 histidine decarboxylase maturation protein HdcB [Levilactobacillus sp.]